MFVAGPGSAASHSLRAIVLLLLAGRNRHGHDGTRFEHLPNVDALTE